MEEETTTLSGEAYVQYMLDQLNLVEVRGSENMERMLSVIRALERLRDDLISSNKHAQHEEPSGLKMVEDL